MFCGEVAKPSVGGQPHHRHQPRGRHEIRFVEPRSSNTVVWQSRIYEMPSVSEGLDVRQAQSCCHARAFSFTDALTHQHRRWIEGKSATGSTRRSAPTKPVSYISR